MHAKFMFFLFLGVASGCVKVEESSEENTAEAAVSAGIGALAGAAHAVSTAAGTFSRGVTACTATAASDTCPVKTKTATYTDCLSSATNQTFSGTVTLTFSDSGCPLTTNAQYVERTVNMTRVLGFTDFPRFNNTTLTTTTETHSDYNTNEIGGGTKLTYVGTNTFDVEVPGVHKVLTNSKGKTLYDISLHTLTPMTLSGTVSGDRTLDGGSLQVAHNRAFYTADLTPVSLRYNSTTCCHPISGVVGVQFGGKAVGTAQVTFTTTCGLATMVRNVGAADEVTSTIPLHGCE